MIFTETYLKGAYVIKSEPLKDDRGFFARSFCQEEFAVHGLNPRIAQCNVSYNKKKGTIRGMHYQVAPYEETKLVSCIRGAIYDVILDLRSDSTTYCKWFAVELTAENNWMVYVPNGFAHGFQTLEDDTTVFYLMSESYHPESAKGVRWNDEIFKIEWVISEQSLSERDRTFPDFKS